MALASTFAVALTGVRAQLIKIMTPVSATVAAP